MIELKLSNVHKVVDSKEKALNLISLGFSIFKDEENIMGVNEIIDTVKEDIKDTDEVVKEAKVAKKKNIEE